VDFEEEIMEDIPRYSYDLIDQLDALVKKPTFPLTAREIGALNQDVIRIAAFQAGQRSLVEMLINAKAEIEEEKAHARSGTDTPDTPTEPEEDSGLGQVLGPDGSQHQTVASVHLAARLIGEDHSDSDKTPSEG
jgi:hypothetical protein